MDRTINKQCITDIGAIVIIISLKPHVNLTFNDKIETCMSQINRINLKYTLNTIL